MLEFGGDGVGALMAVRLVEVFGETRLVGVGGVGCAGFGGVFWGGPIAVHAGLEAGYLHGISDTPSSESAI